MIFVYSKHLILDPVSKGGDGIIYQIILQSTLKPMCFVCPSESIGMEGTSGVLLLVESLPSCGCLSWGHIPSCHSCLLTAIAPFLCPVGCLTFSLPCCHLSLLSSIEKSMVVITYLEWNEFFFFCLYAISVG